MKKKNIFFVGALLIASLLFSSCEITRPIAATSNPVGTKRGVSKACGILMFPPFIGAGNAGIEKAVKKGQITKISTVDFTSQSYILFNIWKCTVTGE